MSKAGFLLNLKTTDKYMFTGIIETVGRIVKAERNGGDLRITLEAPEFHDKAVALGDSIACDGVCLTVVDIQSNQFSFDVSIESLNHSLIGDWQPGAKVNLELALLPTTRLGGHLVSGHVDGIATLVDLKEDARSWRMVFELPQELKKYVAKKGSITINGVSLTVNSVEDNLFDINVIPHTFEVTTLGQVKPGSQVHIEVDLIARYLERLLAGDSSGTGENTPSLSKSFLTEHGFT